MQISCLPDSSLYSTERASLEKFLLLRKGSMSINLVRYTYSINQAVARINLKLKHTLDQTIIARHALVGKSFHS